MLKVAIYARVSTDGQNTDNQVNQLTVWAESRGWDVAVIYRENESAWKAGHQAELTRL